MANNIKITDGSGTSSVAAEEIATIKYQQIKVVDGTAAGTTPMKVNSDGSINASVIGVVQTNTTGSIISVPSGNQSVSGTVGASIIGWVPIQASNSSIITVSQSSSVIAVVTGSITAIPTGNQSVSGTVGASVIGWVPIQPSNTSTIGILQNSSFIAINTGSVITINPGSIIAVFQSSSILAVPVGSVITVWKDSSVLAVPVGSTLGVWDKAPSIVGTYAEDSAHTTGASGLFVLGVQNATMASIVSTDGEYTPFATGPVGEGIVANAPITQWVRGTADLRGPVTVGSVTIIAAQGASVFTYVTAVQVLNMGPTSVIVTLSGATSSIVAYTVAPVGGGSNIVYPNALKTNANAAFSASVSGLSSVLVSAQGFIAKI